MNKFALILGALILTFLSPLQAQAQSRTLTGSYLFKSCHALQVASGPLVDDLFPKWNKTKAMDVGIDVGFCAGFILGFVKAHDALKNETNTPPLFCLPDGATIDSLTATLLDYLEEMHPDNRSAQSGITIITDAMKAAYPCPK